jgi:hypothetical protein
VTQEFTVSMLSHLPVMITANQDLDANMLERPLLEAETYGLDANGMDTRPEEWRARAAAYVNAKLCDFSDS